MFTNKKCSNEAVNKTKSVATRQQKPKKANKNRNDEAGTTKKRNKGSKKNHNN